MTLCRDTDEPAVALPTMRPPVRALRSTAESPAVGAVEARRCRVAVQSRIPIVRAGLETLLAREADRIEVVDAASVDPAPDVLVVDVEAASLRSSGLVAAQSASSTVVVAVGRGSRAVLEARARVCHADGVVAMGLCGAELASQVAASWSIRGLMVRPLTDRPAGLTEREVDVLVSISAGMTNREIAAVLGISVNSVKTYVRGAYRRIGVRNRAQAVVWCLHGGLPWAATVDA